MPKKVEEMIHILCTSRGYLYPIGIMGPIVQPLIVSKNSAIQLLMNGADVYEYIPKSKNTIKLTLSNINDNHRYDEVKPEQVSQPIVEPVVKPGVSISPAISENAEVVEDSSSDFGFEYNEDGTVDESKIDWTKYTKNQRKAIRAKINEHNTSLND